METCPFKTTPTECDIEVIRYCQSGRRHNFHPHPGITINGLTMTKKEEWEIAGYAAYLCNLEVQRSSDIFSNKDEDHAKIVLSDLLKLAKKSVKIFCSEQDIEFFNEPVSDLRKIFHEFLSNLGNIQVEVLLETCCDSSINVLKKLSIPNQIKIKVISPDILRRMKSEIGSERDFHMLLIDGEAYRYEYDLKKHAAICSFNDRPQCRQMTLAFDNAFKNSTSISLGVTKKSSILDGLFF